MDELLDSVEKIIERPLTSVTWRATAILDLIRNYEENLLVEWPCQDTFGGKMPFAYKNFCKHPECHPRNNGKHEDNRETGLELVTKCDDEEQDYYYHTYCKRCNGTKEITRPMTVAEVLELAEDLFSCEGQFVASLKGRVRVRKTP